MKKLLILFLFAGMFLCFERGFISKEASAQINSTDKEASYYQIPDMVQCPYCNTTIPVYSTGKYSCSNCGKYFEVMPGTVSAPHLVAVTPPATCVLDQYYPYDPGWYGQGLNFRFRFRHGGFERGRFVRRHELFLGHRHGFVSLLL